jgi:Protein of unknown function (DUF1573)
MNVVIKKVLPLVFLAFAAGCKNSSDNASGGIPSNLVNNPRTADGIDPAEVAKKPTMDFKDSVYDFGKITEGDIVTHDFTFKNNGKTPLLISGASGSCGCTVPSYPHEPLPPAQSAVMKVTFSSVGKSGPQNKTVTITDNTMKGRHILFIRGEVVPKGK